jgi:isoleucyl-tRNA synthetase
VNWCFDCGSALAEAEVEYQDKKSPAIDVGFRLAVRARARLAHAFGIARCRDGDCRPTVIWTTTPWTLPANQALNMHPDFTYELVQTPKRLPDPAAELRDAALERYGFEAWNPRRLQGRGAGR